MPLFMLHFISLLLMGMGALFIIKIERAYLPLEAAAVASLSKKTLSQEEPSPREEAAKDINYDNQDRYNTNINVTTLLATDGTMAQPSLMEQLIWEAELEEKLMKQYRNKRGHTYLAKGREDDLQMQRGSNKRALLERIPTLLVVKAEFLFNRKGKRREAIIIKSQIQEKRKLHYHSIRNGYIPDGKLQTEKTATLTLPLAHLPGSICHLITAKKFPKTRPYRATQFISHEVTL